MTKYKNLTAYMFSCLKDNKPSLKTFAYHAAFDTLKMLLNSIVNLALAIFEGALNYLIGIGIALFLFAKWTYYTAIFPIHLFLSYRKFIAVLKREKAKKEGAE